MRYCDTCRKVNGWPGLFTYGTGKCEECGELSNLFATPEAELERPKKKVENDPYDYLGVATDRFYELDDEIMGDICERLREADKGDISPATLHAVRELLKVNPAAVKLEAHDAPVKSDLEPEDQNFTQIGPHEWLGPKVTYNNEELGALRRVLRGALEVDAVHHRAEVLRRMIEPPKSSYDPAQDAKDALAYLVQSMGEPKKFLGPVSPQAGVLPNAQTDTTATQGDAEGPDGSGPG